MKKLSIKVYICMFIVVICLPWFIWFFLQRYVDTSNSENRQMAARPQLSMDTYNTFSKEYEAYCNDCLPFRNNLIKLNSTIDYFLFDRSSNSNVIIGKDDWLYLKVSLADYQGTNLMSKRGLYCAARTLKLMQEYVEGQGKQFVFASAPNKNTLYPQYMPDYYRVINAGHNLDFLTPYLQSNGVNYVDLKALFQQFQ